MSSRFGYPANPSTIPFNVPEGRITRAAFAGSGR